MSSGWRFTLARPEITAADRQAVLAVLETTTLCLGPQAIAFEQAMSERLCGWQTAAVANGTAALYLALKALGVDGGEVITPSYGFIGTVHAIRMAGATPKFAEISPETLCVTAETLAAAASPKTRAAIPVHLFGTAIRMQPIIAWANSRGIPIIEDACEALGAVSDGLPAGTTGAASTFAFYANKQITTGEGGIVAASSAATIAKVKSLRNQGRGEEDFDFPNEGFNFRLTEMQAALGRSQLGRLDAILEVRERLAEHYLAALTGVRGVCPLPPVPSGDRRSWFVFPVFLSSPEGKAAIRARLRERGIQTAGYFPAIHRLRPYSEPSFRGPDLAFTEAVAARSFALPFHTGLSRRDLEEIVGELADALVETGSDHEEAFLPTLSGRFA